MKLSISHLVIVFAVSGCSDNLSTPTENQHPKIATHGELYPVQDQPFDALCTPGEKLGTCSVCDEKGLFRIPLLDRSCPQVNCSALDQFILIEDGQEQSCLNLNYETQLTACHTNGRCADHASVDFCPITSRDVVLKTVGPCSTIVGCADGLTPSIEYASDGTPCDTGQCISGQCISNEPVFNTPSLEPSLNCGMFPATPFCGESDEHGDNTVPFCEFRVETPNFRTCDEICAANGSWCLGAWDDARDTCEHQERQTCHTRELDQICRCAQPRLTQGDPFGH